MSTIESIKQPIMADPQNKAYTDKGIESHSLQPQRQLVSISSDKHLDWKLRKQAFTGVRWWPPARVVEDTFYNSGLFAVIPMDFYFPGHGKSGDLPPRKGFAEKWHTQLLKECPDIELTLLVRLNILPSWKVSGKVTEQVHHLKNYLPYIFHSFTFPSQSNLDG